MAASTNRLTITALHLPANGGPSKGAKNPIFGANRATFFADRITLVNNIEPNWSSEGAYGKMDSIPFFSNTTRNLAIDFLTLPAADAGYGPAVMQEQVEKLMKFQYPRYDNFNGIDTLAAPPFFNIRFYKVVPRANRSATLYNDVQGYIKQFKVTPGHAGALSDDKLPVLAKNKKSMLETAFSISFVLTVLHRSPPGWNGNNWTSDNFYAGSAAVANVPMTSPVTALPEDTVNEMLNKETSEQTFVNAVTGERTTADDPQGVPISDSVPGVLE